LRNIADNESLYKTRDKLNKKRHKEAHLIIAKLSNYLVFIILFFFLYKHVYNLCTMFASKPFQMALEIDGIMRHPVRIRLLSQNAQTIR